MRSSTSLAKDERTTVHHRPKVILVTENASERARWTRELVGDCEVDAVKDLPELEHSAGKLQQPVDVVISEWHEPLFAQFRKMRGVRLIHCGPLLPDGLVDAVAQGYNIAHVDTVEELHKQVLSLSRIKRSTVLRHEPDGFIVCRSGSQSSHPLLEISNEGFSFHVGTDQDLEPLLPGTVLDDLQLFHQSVLVLSGVTMVVRHVAVITEPSSGYRIGCEIRPGSDRRSVDRVVSIRDRAWCVALIRTALRSGGILLHKPDQTTWGVHCTGGQVDAAKRELTVPAADHAFSNFDLVQGRFEVRGNVYRFSTAVMRSSPLCLRLPSSIEETQKRSSARFQPPPDQPVEVELTSPLLSCPLMRPVLDVSGTGFSFEIDAQVDLFPAGMWFSEIALRVGERHVRCRGQVRNLARLPYAAGKLRCGVEFDGLDDSARVEIADLIMRSKFPSLDDGRAIGFDELWRFFVESRFMYPKKESTLAPLMGELRRTFSSLNSRPNKLFKSVVFHKGSQIQGYVSGVRAYRNTWLSQHLAASSGGPTGPLLNFGLGEYFGQNIDLEYGKIYFRPENRWPARVFGGFARNISDRHLSDLTTYAYFTLPTNEPLLSMPIDIRVIQPGDRDLSLVERHFVTTESGLIIRSDDLTRGSLSLRELNENYGALGLQRRREVLLALHGDKPVAFALAEISSPGLNLSELLSAFRIHLLVSPGEIALRARAALLVALVQFYRREGRPFAVGMAKLEELPSYEQLGIVTQKRYCCWTGHRTLYLRFWDHVDRLVKALVARQRRHLWVPNLQPARSERPS